MEAIWTNYNGRYDEICHHCGGNVLGPKSVAYITKPEKAKAKELATKRGSVYTVEFSVCKSNKNSPLTN